ncbi:MBL fold metallo-hydrolase [Candidatus Gracilibacteria bacterium]|nr:MBL fold metallo-hydrolase [Candidatus Gracilibacteria bacterium]
MKIQFHGQNCFSIHGKDVSLAFDPNETLKGKFDFVMNSGGFQKACDSLKDIKKVLQLPGEFEISGALVRGFYSRLGNVVYKVTLEGVSFVHLGSLESKPSTEFFEKLGENVDVVLVTLSDKFGVKDVKDLIETLDPRYTFIGGSQSFFPKMVEEGARIAEENPLNIAQTSLNEERSDVLILPI